MHELWTFDGDIVQYAGMYHEHSAGTSSSAHLSRKVHTTYVQQYLNDKQRLENCHKTDDATEVRGKGGSRTMQLPDA